MAKIIVAPLFAYFTEPFPWASPPPIRDTWGDFGHYNYWTFAYLEHIYNAETWSNDLLMAFNVTTSTYATRTTMTFSPNANLADTINHFVGFPGAVSYGSGICSFITKFIQHVDSRSTRFQCQRALYFGVPSSDSCLWFESTKDDNVYMVYYATILLDGPILSWSKFTIRCSLSIYITWTLWRRYYSTFESLKVNLRDIGVAKDYVGYEIYPGDATCLIVSDPFVSLIFVIDLWLAVPYTSLSILRICQFEHVGFYLLGCMYMARTGWIGYFGMKCASMIVKKIKWESSFTPIDPGLMAIAASLNSGPMATLYGMTSLSGMFQVAGELFLPPELKGQAIDATFGLLT
ncbi:hypothetical protein AeMF1_009532 [Aphanomyces euteiches]|nr:hypothetical protein AeMF1_009532 [Aphanomyces euteiches]KAH9185188.1 hypothetical protein AeNC1_012836 [Aphanomyces euteiches]